MIGRDEYVREKLQELDRERRRRPHRPPPREPRGPRRIGAPIVRRAGRGIRQLGEALEAWAAPLSGDARR